jgi:hypothetical protein
MKSGDDPGLFPHLQKRTQAKRLRQSELSVCLGQANVGIFGVFQVRFFAAFRYRFVTFGAD